MTVQILGATPVIQRTIRVPIGKNKDGQLIEVEMRPVKFGRLIEIDKEIPEPMAPSTGEKKRVGGQIIKRNGTPVMVRDTEDPGYISKCELREMAVKVAIVVDGLGDQLTGLSEQEEGEAGVDYWLRILDELLGVGIDQGIFTSLAMAAQQLSQPMNNLELMLLRQALGTHKETDAVTEEQEEEGIAQAAKAEAEGKD